MTRTILAALGAAFLATATVGAHHSYARFDLDRTVTIQGELEKVLYANPHVVLTLRTSQGDVYTAEWRSAFQLNSAGVIRTTLSAGDKLVLTGNPSRDAAAHQMARLTEVVRPADGWRWGSGPSPTGTVSRP